MTGDLGLIDFQSLSFLIVVKLGTNETALLLNSNWERGCP